MFGDYKFAAKVLHVPKSQIEFYSTRNGETGIKVRNKGGVNKIGFEHARSGAEGFKGMRPSEGNRWLCVRFYELTNFINGNPTELSNTIATFIRDAYSNPIGSKIKKYCDDHGYEFVQDKDGLIKQHGFAKNGYELMTHEFCIEYEFNTPGADEKKGGWVLNGLADKKQAHNVYYQFNNYLDMYDWEKFKFIKGETLDEIENIRLTDPVTYNHVYLGKMPYDGDICFPNLSKNIHYGKFENFNPDVLCIGIDVGTSDPTVCTLNGFEFRGKDLRIQLGMHRGSHSNRKQQYCKDGVLIPYRSWDINQYADMILEFCEMVHQEYPTHTIVLQMDRAGAGRDFYALAFRYKDPTFLDINRLGLKPSPDKRVNALQTAFTVPGVVKICDPVLFQAYHNQIWDPRKREESGERKRLDDPARAGLDMDSQDSCEYGVPNYILDLIIERVRKTRGKWDAGKYGPIVKMYDY